MPAPLAVNPLPQLTLDRLASDLARLQARCWATRTPLSVAGSQQLTAIGGVQQAEGLDYGPVAIGDTWGLPHDDWRQRWFRLTIPAAQPGEAGRRHLLWRANGEHTVHWQGSAWAGLDCAHPSCLLPDAGGELLIESCLWQTAIWAGPQPITPTGCRFDGAWLALRDEAAWHLYQDLRVPVEQALHLRGLGQAGNSWEGGNHHCLRPLAKVPPLLRLLVDRLQRAFQALDSEGVAAAQRAADALYAELRAEPWAPTATLIGHSHLDLVWRWTEAATRRKWVHTAATVAGLMDRDPNFTFINSQPWLLGVLAEDDPELHRRVSAHIASGRWELEGIFEVESDVLLSGGETLVRCLVRGQQAFQARSGRQTQVLWIPDVFGYSGCLPQLIRLAGGTGFYTNKLTWNRITPFPYTSFVWQGDDGTEVLAHLPPIGFGGSATVRELSDAVAEHRQLAVHPELLCPVGYGDGGGGPTEDLLERVRRQADFAGLPRCRWGSAATTFERLEAVRSELPRFRGELYLEAHRATPVVQVAHKQAFRESERALQTWEAAAALCGSGPLPEDAWERTVFASFHDAIPGSSIGAVYTELNPQLLAVAARARRGASELLAGDHGPTWYNPVAVPWRGLVSSEHGLEAVELPALAATPVATALRAVSAPTWSDRVLTNGRVRAAFSIEGHLQALDLDGHTVPLTASPGLWLGPDHPRRHDAWETDADDLALLRPLLLGPLTALPGDPLRWELTQDVCIDDRVVGQLLWRLDADSEALDLRLDIGWQQAHRMLRFLVPTAHRGRLARFGAPFGAAQRPQLPSYEQDEARWDGAGSRWAAVCDDGEGAGLALITEASYGFAVRDGTLCLNLLRAPADPDPACDQGQHRIRWQMRRWRAVSDHNGPGTALAAELAYTQPQLVGRAQPSLATWIEPGGLVPSWVQPVDDGFVLRAHDASGRPGSAILALRPGTAAPEPIDFLGAAVNDVQCTDLGDSRWRIEYRAYQIVSLRCRCADTQGGPAPTTHGLSL